MEGEYAFCPDCGSPVVVPPNPVQPMPPMPPMSPMPTPTPIVQPKKLAIKLSKRAKILVASGIVVVLLIVGVYFLGKYLTDEQRLFERFEHAVKADEADKLFELLSSSN